MPGTGPKAAGAFLKGVFGGGGSQSEGAHYSGAPEWQDSTDGSTGYPPQTRWREWVYAHELRVGMIIRESDREEAPWAVIEAMPYDGVQYHRVALFADGQRRTMDQGVQVAINGTGPTSHGDRWVRGRELNVDMVVYRRDDANPPTDGIWDKIVAVPTRTAQTVVVQFGNGGTMTFDPEASVPIRPL